MALHGLTSVSRELAHLAVAIMAAANPRLAAASENIRDLGDHFFTYD